MSSGLFKTVILKMCSEIIYLIYMYKKDLALNELQWSICHKTKPNYIDIDPRSPLAQSGRTWLVPIYGKHRTVWNLNWVQTNNLDEIELLEIELFDHLTVCKQMTNV